MTTETTKLQPGDRVILNGGHPWSRNSGTLVKEEEYGLINKRMGWLIELDGNGCRRTYAQREEFSVMP